MGRYKSSIIININIMSIILKTISLSLISLTLSPSSPVVTGASEGIGRGYALEVRVVA